LLPRKKLAYAEPKTSAAKEQRLNNAIRYSAIFAASLLANACADSVPVDATVKAGIGAPQCASDDCAKLGGFSPPFSEPTIDGSNPSPPEAPANPLNERPGDDRCLYDESGRPIKCKPTAGSIAVLRDGRLLYFNALEGTERVEFSIFFEAGHALQNDQTRVMALGDGVSWIKPSPNDGGANPEGQPPSSLLPPGTADTQAGRNNDGALFCADLAQLADGRIMAVGGTDYYLEPGMDPIPFGISELEGLRNARVFNPGDNRWSKTGDMAYGRWYPTVVNLENGDVLVASGVTKLLKPVYPDRLMQSGRNVAETETYDLCSGAWTDNGALAQRSLPLYPRLHLLPNGHVLYNAAGQAFNPFGQAYDQATWNFTATYDPGTKTWSDLAYAGLPALPPDDPVAAAMLAAGSGFRGSTFSIMLPLKPDGSGQYNSAEFLTAGGVTGNLLLTSPGSNQPTALTRIDTVTVGTNNALGYASRAAGSLTAARWYGTGVLLPTGEVMVFSGADRDEVQLPGTGIPILRSERFDPVSETWSAMALQGRPRTYHNTAVLLPDGRVLVGGHAPINTAYGYSVTIPGFSPNDGRDPSFEIYSPPYAFGPRPVIRAAPAELRAGEMFTLTTPQAASVDSVVLVRRTDLTHLVDADQRSVVLPILERRGDALQVRMPVQRAVVPPGQYMLFINAPGPNGMAPSVSVPVSIPAGRC
jgi:hypothetical protein